MYTASQSFLGLRVVHLSQFQVQLAESVPLRRPANINKRWEVKRRVVAHILIGSLLCSVNKEVPYTLINRCHVFETSNKRSYILESLPADNPGCRVLQKVEIKILQLLCGLVQRRYFGKFSDNFSTCFAHPFFFILGKDVLVKRENFLVEAVYADLLADVDDVASYGLTHVAFGIHTQ